MLKLLTTRRFNGFGKGVAGELFFSENMVAQDQGFAPFLKHSVSFANPNDVLHTMTQILQLGQTRIYGVGGASANLYRYADSAWSRYYVSGSINFLGVISDQKNRLLFSSARFLGKYEESLDYTTGTIDVTNGSASVTGSGTTWTTADHTGFRIRIGNDTTWYTFTRNSATTGTLSSTYAGVTGTYTYRIYSGLNEQWKDFGGSAGSFVPFELYEDTVLVGRGNAITTLNVTTDTITTDASPAFSMPSAFSVRAISANSNGILMGFNQYNNGVLVLWDNYSDRSIAPWIWTNGNILSIRKYGGNWLVITQYEIILTNGYSAQTFALPIDTPDTKKGFAVYPNGTVIVGETLIIGQNDVALSEYFGSGAGNSTVFSRNRAGFYFLNLVSKRWGYLSLNGATRGTEIACLFQDNLTSRIWTAYQKGINLSATKAIGQIEFAVPTTASFITEKLGVSLNKKTAEAVIPELSMESLFNTDSYPISFSLTVKIAPFTKKLFTYAKHKTAAANATTFTVDGTQTGFNNAEVGDEITIIEGANAGLVRHITAISGAGTSTEVWTLDAALTGNMEQDAFAVVSPFKKLGSTQTFSSATELKDLFFNGKNKIHGRKFLVKLLFENMANIAPKVDAVHFAYDDLGEY